VPKRGKPNRPEYLAYTLEMLANLRGLPLETMDAITSQNARVVYGIV